MRTASTPTLKGGASPRSCGAAIVDWRPSSWVDNSSAADTARADVLVPIIFWLQQAHADFATNDSASQPFAGASASNGRWSFSTSAMASVRSGGPPYSHRSPSVTLALAIGVTTAVFSQMRATILAPLPFPEGDRLVSVWPSGGSLARSAVSVPTYESIKEDLDRTSRQRRDTALHGRRRAQQPEPEPDRARRARARAGRARDRVAVGGNEGPDRSRSLVSRGRGRARPEPRRGRQPRPVDAPIRRRSGDRRPHDRPQRRSAARRRRHGT